MPARMIARALQRAPWRRPLWTVALCSPDGPCWRGDVLRLGAGAQTKHTIDTFLTRYASYDDFYLIFFVMQLWTLSML